MRLTKKQKNFLQAKVELNLVLQAWERKFNLELAESSYLLVSAGLISLKYLVKEPE